MSEDKRSLLLYDISQAKTYRKTMKILDEYCCARIQKSAYEIIESPERTKELFNRLQSVFNQETDRLALVTLCEEDWEKALTAGLPQSFNNQLKTFYIL